MNAHLTEIAKSVAAGAHATGPASVVSASVMCVLGMGLAAAVATVNPRTSA